MTKREVEASVYDLAVERVGVMYDRFDHVAVSFSGGKDSTVALQVTLEVAERRGRLPLDVVFWDEEALHPPTIEYVQRVGEMAGVALRWFCLPIRHRNACSKAQPYWFPWAPEDRARWVRELPAQAITGAAGFPVDPVEARLSIPECNRFLFPDPSRRVGLVTGIRAQESLRRFEAVTHRTYDNWMSVDQLAPHVTVAKPIYDWRMEDVWTAPAKFGWDYNRTYDHFNAAGVPLPQQRVCPPFGEEPLQGLWRYAVLWPELWEKMQDRVAGARTAARYSRSPLYGYGSRGKPDGMTWEEAIRHELAKWPPAERAKIAAHIRRRIRWHNHMTGNAPIPDEAKLGLSWAWLYKVACRGDLKGRKRITYDERYEHGPIIAGASRALAPEKKP